MLDKASFMETLHGVMELAKTSEQPMSREEVMGYFDGIDLTQEQEELVYQFMLTNQQGEAFAGDTKSDGNTSGKADKGNGAAMAPVVQELKQSEQKQKEAEKAFLNAPYVKMYLKDIRSIKRLKQEELLPYYERLLAGEDEAAEVVLHNYLRRVVDIAKRYVLLKVNMEDVVQEGNMGLLLAVKRLKGKGEQKHIKRYIENEIKQSMEDYIDQTMEDDNWEQMVLGRARLLQDAREALAKELLHVPSMAELSEYTHLPEEEIADIMSLIKEKREG